MENTEHNLGAPSEPVEERSNDYTIRVRLDLEGAFYAGEIDFIDGTPSVVRLDYGANTPASMLRLLESVKHAGAGSSFRHQYHSEEQGPSVSARHPHRLQPGPGALF